MNRITVVFCMSLLLLVGTPAVAADPWTPTQRNLEIVYQLALLVDYRQTSSYHRTWNCPPTTVVTSVNAQGGKSYTRQYSTELTECNPFLGSHPTQATINHWGLVSSVGHLVISHYLPTKWRTRWQGVSVAVEVVTITHNYVNCTAAIRW